jgi:hypothetical protein
MLTLAGCRQVFGIDPPTGTLTDDAGLPPADNGFRSGTRLKLMWNDYSGVREYTGLFDSELASQCTPQTWSDGDTYCTPIAGIARYLDAACTTPVGDLVPVGCAPIQESFFAVTDAMGCGSNHTYHLYQVEPTDQPLSYTPTTIYKRVNGACTAFPNSDAFVMLTKEIIPSSDLVQQTLDNLAGARLVQQVYDGADGSEIRGPIYDTMLGVTCTPTSDNGGECAPATDNSYADTSCTTAVAFGVQGCLQPKYGAQPLHPNCAVPDETYHQTGAVATGLTPYDYSSGSCQADPTHGIEYYELAATVTTVPLATRLEPPPVAGAQIVRAYNNDGTSDVGPLGLYDTVHHIACKTIGGECLPSATGEFGYFSDTACTQPLSGGVYPLTTEPTGCASPPVPTFFTATSPRSACPWDPSAKYRVFEITSPITVQAYTPMGGMCIPGQVVIADAVLDSEFAGAMSGMDP